MEGFKKKLEVMCLEEDYHKVDNVIKNIVSYVVYNSEYDLVSNNCEFCGREIVINSRYGYDCDSLKGKVAIFEPWYTGREDTNHIFIDKYMHYEFTFEGNIGKHLFKKFNKYIKKYNDEVFIVGA